MSVLGKPFLKKFRSKSLEKKGNECQNAAHKQEYTREKWKFVSIKKLGQE